MSNFPDFAGIILEGYKESIPDPSVKRTDMERGPAIQQVMNKRVYQNISLTIMFEAKSDIELFYEWYFNDIRRAGFFALKHPRTGRTIQARFPSGKIGELLPVKSGFGISTITADVEYMP